MSTYMSNYFPNRPIVIKFHLPKLFNVCEFKCQTLNSLQADLNYQIVF